jgi:hypothetical protein
MPAIGVISNPNSRKNRRAPAGRIERLRRIVGGWGTVTETPGLDALRPALRDLLRARARWFVSDGGDGALHWMLNELGALGEAGELGDEPPTVLPTNGGTIDFVARKAGVRGRAEGILEELTRAVAAGKAPPACDLDSLELTGEIETPDGHRPLRRIGFALAAGGIGQRFFDKYYGDHDPGAAAIVRVVARAVASWAADRLQLPVPAALLAYGREIFRPTPARVTIDGRVLAEREFGAIHAGAFDVTLGGVFRVFPLAARPGRVQFQAGGIVPAEMIRALPDLVRGRMIRSRSLTDQIGGEMLVEALGDELLCPIVDGELFCGLRWLRVRRGPRVRIARVVA